MLKKWLKTFTREHSKSSIALIAIGSITWILTVIKSGILYSYGIGFWGPHGHDVVWHIAIAEGLSRGTWEIPVFAGETIKNYHVGFNLLLSWLNKITFIPVANLYFQIIAPILAVLIGIFVYRFVHLWRGSKTQALWATFFVYFGGGLGWLISLIRSGEIGGESLFWSQQSISTLLNPPFALSILIIFIGMTYLVKGIKTNDKNLLYSVSFLFGIVVLVKVYAGILVLGALFSAGVWWMYKGHGFKLLRVFIGSLIISMLLILPVISGAERTIIFKPFWFLETMMAFSDRFFWPRFAEAMVNYKLGGNIIKGALAYTVAFLIFLVGNFGTRLVKDFWVFPKLREFKNLFYIDVFIFFIIITGIIIPLFFVQRGTPWNTIQFLYYSLAFSGILAGVWLGGWLEDKKLKTKHYLVTGAIVLFTIPTTIGTLRHYLPARPPAMISRIELEALNYLSIQSEGVILTYPFDKDAADAAIDNPPRPLRLYESTAYVSAFTKKPVYLEDEVNLEITGYDWRDRREKSLNFFASPNREFLLDNNIQYIYITPQVVNINAEELGLEKLFENREVVIFSKK